MNEKIVGITCGKAEKKQKNRNKKNGINNGEHLNLPDELYFGIWVLFWYLVLPFGRNPLHVQRGILCDRSFHPDISLFNVSLVQR